MSEQRCVQIDGRDYTVSPWTLRETLGKRPIVDGLPDMYRRVPDSEPDSDEDDASSAADVMSHYHKHYDQTDREKDAVRYRRDQTSRQFAVSQSKRPCCCNTCCPRKPTYSKKALAKDFQSAHHTLKIRWQDCHKSHANKIAMAKSHNKRMQPYTKIELLQNLDRKMRSFASKLENLPLAHSVDTGSKKQAYLQDAESIMKNLDAFIIWNWDDQAIEYMGF